MKIWISDMIAGAGLITFIAATFVLAHAAAGLVAMA
jgi:hypothetical protein